MKKNMRRYFYAISPSPTVNDFYSTELQLKYSKVFIIGLFGKVDQPDNTLQTFLFLLSIVLVICGY